MEMDAVAHHHHASENTGNSLLTQTWAAALATYQLCKVRSKGKLPTCGPMTNQMKQDFLVPLFF